MKQVAIIACAGFVAATGALAKPPAPEFVVQSLFEENIAHVLARHCDMIERDHHGIERHRLHRMARLSDMGVHSRNQTGRYAPVSDYRMNRHAEKFLAKHNLAPDAEAAEFCSAGIKEIKERSAVGLMLRKVAQ